MAETTLPTANCTPELHERYHGACFWCCGSCNYDTHRCPACGDNLRHDQRQYDGAFHPCIQPVCPECEAGKHENCTEWALDCLDEEVTCACKNIDHKEETRG